MSRSAYYTSCCWQATRNRVATHTQHAGGRTGGSMGDNGGSHSRTCPLACTLQTSRGTTPLLFHLAKNVQAHSNWNVGTPSRRHVSAAIGGWPGRDNIAVAEKVLCVDGCTLQFSRMCVACMHMYVGLRYGPIWRRVCVHTLKEWPIDTMHLR